jgi:hypothetical protein
VFEEISLDSVDLMFGEAVITAIKWADAIFYNFQLARCDMNCIKHHPIFSFSVFGFEEEVLYARDME